MPALPDYYRILGVETDADDEAVKRAYRLLVRSCHPDKNPSDDGAAERFVRIQQAYRVLSQQKARGQYDRRRSENVFADIIKRECAAAQNSRGETRSGSRSRDAIHLVADLSLEDALRGGPTSVRGPAGEGRRVTIPPGCKHGTTVRLRGAGVSSAAGEDRDVLVTFRIKPHPRFKREGDHLHVMERISAVEAMLGAARSIPTPYGQLLRLTIPPGTQPGHRFRLVGQGVRTAEGTGDLFVEIDVEVPKSLTEEQREQLRRTVESLGLL